MTPEKQRIAIAEACGWKKEYIHGNGVDDYVWICPLTKRYWLDELSALPDYLSDLNAMHEAEKVLLNSGKSGIWTTYLYWLEAVCDVPMHHATAAQRAEAFLRTLNLWQNS